MRIAEGSSYCRPCWAGRTGYGPVGLAHMPGNIFFIKKEQFFGEGGTIVPLFHLQNNCSASLENVLKFFI
jgi:hypothetical protein